VHRTQSSKFQVPSSKNKKQIVNRFAELDASNPQSNTPVFNVAARPTFIPDFATPRFRLTPHHFAYVKIARAAIIRAAFASFLKCEARIAVGSKRTSSPKRSNSLPKG